jgi:hypothetical protein
LGLVTLIRPINGIIILAVPFLSGSFTGFKDLIFSVFKDKSRLLISLFIFSATVFIQLIILFLTYGDFFHWPYRGEGFDFRHPHFTDILFSYKKGLFIYTPLMFISILFIINYFRKSIFAAISFILFFVILTYVLSSWSSWFYGGSYGLRAYIEYFPLFILPLGIGLTEITRKIVKAFILVLLTSVLLVNLIQTYQFEYCIIHFSDMTKEKYWNVFLHTDRRYKLFSSPVVYDAFDESKAIEKKTYSNDFEGNIDWGSPNTITTEQSLSGKKSSRIKVPDSFSPVLIVNFNDLERYTYVKASIFSKTVNSINEGLLIVSFENKYYTVYVYDFYPLNLIDEDMNKWVPITASIKIPQMNPGDVMKVYVWNDSKNPVYIDDLKVELFKMP